MQRQNSAQFFVTGIGTEVGKTVVSAMLVRALAAAYWKPVQAGDLDWTDTDKVRLWSAGESERFFPERHRLLHPMSPHAAAAREGVEIRLADFQLPATDLPLIVEGAGGLYVPLNDRETMLDLIGRLGLPVVLVSRHYLGSINHTLLSIEALRSRQISLAALIFNGPPNPETETAIERLTGIRALCRVDELREVNVGTVTEQARKHGELVREKFLRPAPAG